MSKRHLIGIIDSVKMHKTVVVKVESTKTHPKYLKRFKVHKRYPAQIGEGEFKAGDRVVIEECRPISKTVHWRVISKI
ncbi:MAG: 30S ribosomal protein S17 [Candidatus Doudnabacteria bacterium RIFCSPLOWO2_02_FULL_48_8]|uniref:30S ribosomal protein S17 n=1 Tax=Candidatus Doudnabacteria bacterium RIFCSPHIGHO2_01_FULL_46_24 TaxID=1817825 RepID=A0A1F5NUY3_9BACT|nr:ribosomal protein S17 [uncultured bacterium]OGE81468.1 MAG: 30S ribosomal protein S17 [Candidatus Doudnabacteria bacterium RIFCSPHIGHO2_01_FULL_46_24]OGE95060.1 MAG: 30S ribosomal protein S17 [Candidatus Doudnabacteria bacterium RIFCSPLOWO2_02_FULL_48_8]OGE95914.1 MAG: 30S ribosomal protein S17 [Candidatus Doudnabacteria bacterium RIFCSPHIGHO2_12_FULL_48_11]